MATVAQRVLNIVVNGNEELRVRGDNGYASRIPAELSRALDEARKAPTITGIR